MNSKLNSEEIIVVAVLAAVYLSLIIFSPSGFWIIDEGNKYIWAKNFFAVGDFTLEDRAAKISPGHSAFKSPFSQEADEPGEQMTTFSPIFIILIAPLVGWGGLKLALLIPVIASLLLIVAVNRLAHNLGLRFGLFGMLILGLASPILFYSITLWEHGLAILLGVTALNLSLSGEHRPLRQMCAGGIMAFSIFIRPEMAVFALGGWIFVLSRKKSVLWGSVIGFASMMGLSLLLIGNPLPLNITANFTQRWVDGGLGGLLLGRLDSLYALVLEGSDSVYLSAVIIAAAAAFFILPGVFKFILPAVLIILVIVSWFDPTPFFHLGSRNSLLYTVPFFFAALGMKSDNGAVKSLKRFVIFTIVFTAVMTPVFRGIHYGPRLILPVIPLLAILSISYLHKTRRGGNIFKLDALYGLVFIQLLVTIWGITLLEGRRSANIVRRETILAQSRHSIITLQWWLQQEIPELYFTRDFYLVEDLLDFKIMLVDYYQEGVRFFTLLARENESSDIFDIFNAAPPKQIGAFPVHTEYPSMNLVGLNYAIGFDVEGAAELADELGVYFGQIEKLPESEKYLRFATAWDSYVGKYHYNLGYCLGKQGRYSEALKELQIAGELDPDNETITRLTYDLRKAMEGDNEGEE